MSRIVVAALVAVTVAGGCSIPEQTFRASADAAPDAPGTGALSIIPSVTALTVLENGTKELAVQLSQAPEAPLTVQVDVPANAPISLTLPDLTFDASSFDRPRTVIVTGLADNDIADGHAEISLKAQGVATVGVEATVDDMDVVALVTTVAQDNIINVKVGQPASVRVKLSHKPDGDLNVQAILGTGPCSVTGGANRVFTPDNWEAEQVFTFTAAADANAMNDDQPLTLRIVETNTDRSYTLRERDDDILQIVASPDPLPVTEDDAAGNKLNVSLNHEPSGTVTVNVTVVAETGNVTIDNTQLQFNAQNYAMAKQITVRGAGDANIENGTAKVRLAAQGLTTLEVTVNITDDDQQSIVHNVQNALNIDELEEVAFTVRLAQEPSQPVTVSVSTLASGVATITQGASLMFTAQNYTVPQEVKVRGAHDTNLAPNATKVRLTTGTITTQFDVNVSDIDEQEILVTPSTLTIAEGTSKKFDVTLKYDPGTTVTANVMSDNPTAVPIPPPGTLSFTSANYNVAHPVTLSPPLDTNDVSESALVTISGAGAMASKTVMVSVTDGTDIDTWGWPTPFTATTTVAAGAAIAYKIDVGAVANLASFHTYVPTATGLFRMALYTDAGNVPGTLVAEMPAGKVVVNGVNDGPVILNPPPQLTQPSYFLVIRFSADVNIGYAPIGTTGRQCFRNVFYSTVNEPWSTTFGASSCSTARLMNMWITTYHQ